MSVIVCSRSECQTTAGCKCLDREVSLYGHPRVIERRDAEIAALRAQVEELRRERDANARDGYLCGQRLADMEARATAAEARCAELESQLETYNTAFDGLGAAQQEAERLRSLIRQNWTGNCWRAVNDQQQDEVRVALLEKSDG